jgi:Ion channel.
MKNSRIIWKLIKINKLDRVLVSFLGWMILTCVVLIIAEPAINDLGTALWYCFEVIATVGFGDIPVVTAIGRIVTVVMGMYGIVVLAVFTAIVVDFYQEKMKIMQRESIMEFMDKLEKLPELSREELAEISERVKRFSKEKK